MQWTEPAGMVLAVLVIPKLVGARPAAERRSVMPLTPELQFQKALLLLDRGEIERGESILREVVTAADASGDEVLRVRCRCCLGELLVELERAEEAKPFLEFVSEHSVSSDLDDVLDVEQQTARGLLARLNGGA